MGTTDRGPGWTPSKRLDGKVAVVIGAGQSPGEGVGNGRATAMRFAREGARVLSVDRNLDLAEETAAMIRNEGCDCVASRRTSRGRASSPSHEGGAPALGLTDILHNNVGVSLLRRRGPAEITEEALDNIYRINLRGTVFAAARRGDRVSSVPARPPSPRPRPWEVLYVAYKAKGGVGVDPAIGAAERAFDCGSTASCRGSSARRWPSTRARTWNQPREQVLAERIAAVGRTG
jgi:NAD(P)-dependent dehydrogenase (short-subunit alcohol dehydrogenase family)